MGTDDAEQLLDREAVGMLLVHRRDIVEPVEIGQRLQIGLGLDQLLGAAMQQADMRVDALDDFAVQLQHKAQNAMRRRMLRAEIDGEVADVRCSPMSFSPRLLRLLVAREHVVGALPWREEVELGGIPA